MDCFDERGLRLTANGGEAVARYDRTVRRYLEYRLDTLDELNRTLVADPDFPMAHCLKGCFGMLMGTVATRPMVAGELDWLARRAGELLPRERLHVQALRAWHDGDLRTALARWDEILFDHPRDLLALRLQHFTQFWMGRDRAMRNSVAAVLPAWDETVPGYGYALSMIAFGHEECGDFGTAERLGRQAVAMNPDDLWGVHAVAHVLEMQGRLREGAAWLTPPADRWADRNAMRGHLWWHATLFPLEQGRYGRVLELYDEAVRPGEKPFYLDMQNAAALLARLEFRGVDVGDRWRQLVAIARQRVDDHAILFTDLHHALILARAGDRADTRALLASLDRFATRPGDHEAGLVEPLVRPLAAGMIAYFEGRAGEAVELMLPLRHELQPVGGSHTQRDLFHQLLLEAAIAAGRLEVARSLAAERVTIRPHSVFNWQRLAAVHELAGDPAAARDALGRAAVAGSA